MYQTGGKIATQEEFGRRKVNTNNRKRTNPDPYS